MLVMQVNEDLRQQLNTVSDQRQSAEQEVQRLQRQMKEVCRLTDSVLSLVASVHTAVPFAAYQ